VRDVRRAQVATFAIFLLTGLVSATWAARIPATQERLHLSLPDLGLAVLCIEAGALLGLPLAGALVARRGSRWCLRLGFAFYPLLLLLVGLAPSFGWLGVLLAGWAAANSIIDVAMNAAGLELEARAGRPMLSRLHAAHSMGLLGGALGAVSAAAAHISVPVHFGAVAVVGAVVGLAGSAHLPPGSAGSRTPVLVRPDRRLVLLGIVAFCVFLIEGGANNWAAVHVSTVHQAGAALGAAGYTGFTIAVALVRLGGDRAIARFGRVRLVQTCGIATTAGGVVVVLAPTAVTALAGWTLVGAGLALLAPTVLGAVPDSDSGQIAPATRIAGVTTLGYLGSFSGPPLIGAMAGVVALSTALGILAVASAATVLLAPVALQDRTTEQRL
jgi:MFS family permease